MLSNVEIRKAARQTLKDGGFRWRSLAVVVLLIAVTSLVLWLIQYGYGKYGVQTIGDFARMQMKAAQAGLVMEPPSAAAARQMFTASSFQTFVELLMQGICAFGLAVMALRIVRRSVGGLVGGAFKGFADPFAMLWITLVMMLRIFLWALLLIVPGIVAYVRYGLVWMLRADHPDWGAERCIAESSRLMAGHKWQLFSLKVHYVCMAMIIAAVMILLTGYVAESGVLPPLATGLIVGLATCMILYLMIELNVAHGVFYLNLLKDKKLYDERETDVSAAGQDSP